MVHNECEVIYEFHSISWKQKLLVLMALCLLFVICGLAVMFVPMVNSDVLAAVTTVRSATPVAVSGETLCSRFINANVDPTVSPILYEAQQRRYQACLADYNTRLTPKPMSARQMTVEAPRTIFAPTSVFPRTPAGAGTIIDDSASPMGPMYVIENSWLYETNVIRYGVFAGARREEGPPQPRITLQGIVSVWVWALSGEPYPGGQGGTYNTPSKKGPVRIVGAQGQRLILKTDDGTTLYFDFPSRRFVSSLTEIVPTITPLVGPTLKPYP